MRKYQIKTVLKNTSQLVSQLQTLATTGFIQLRQFKQFIFSFFIYLQSKKLQLNFSTVLTVLTALTIGMTDSVYIYNCLITVL